MFVLLHAVGGCSLGFFHVSNCKNSFLCSFVFFAELCVCSIVSFIFSSLSRHVQKDIAKKRYLRKHLLWEVLQSDEHSRNDTEK